MSFLIFLEIGSCRAAGYETCCTDGVCIGEPSSALCFCDETCEIFQDCCNDYYEICGGECAQSERNWCDNAMAYTNLNHT